MELLYSLDDEYHAEWVTTSDSLSSYICDMIDALRSLHNKGFVHRDVKPEVRSLGTHACLFFMNSR